MECYTYVVRCSDGTLYTGWTNDLPKRIAAHNAGKGAKYTRSRLPVVLVYAECHADKISAMRREYRIKRMTRAEKDALIESKRNIAEEITRIFETDKGENDNVERRTSQPCESSKK